MMRTTLKNIISLTGLQSIKAACIVLSFISLAGCEKFLDVGAPQSQLLTTNVFEDISTARSAMTAAYSYIVDRSLGARLPLQTGLYCDEFEIAPFSSGRDEGLYLNIPDAEAAAPSDFWNFGYKLIYYANSIIDGCEQSATLNDSDKNQFIAESKFLRAWMYLNLTSIYGTVPLVLNINYAESSHLQRTSQSEVYQQIVKDLRDAQAIIKPYYVDAKHNETSLRVRANLGAVNALLARTYLYQKDYVNAEASASLVINNKTMYDTVSLDDVFLINSREAIWQLGARTESWNEATREGDEFLRFYYWGVVSHTLTEDLAESFDPQDLRKVHWLGNFEYEGDTYYFPFKYKDIEVKPARELSTVLRLGETYLIRAEARAEQSKVSEAQSDLNVIRKRAGLPDTDANTKDGLLSAILQERRVELFAEWGHRWFDIKRSQKVNELMQNIQLNKGIDNWQPYKQYWPIAQLEVDKNENILQTEGY